MSWGQEVFVDCRNCNGNASSRNQITRFVTDLCKQIDMTAVGAPVFVHIDDLGDKSGWTVFQMIRTSSVVAHFCENGDAFFDIFSCKDIDEYAVLNTILKWFGPGETKTSKIVRGDW